MKTLIALAALALFGCLNENEDGDETQDGGNVVFAQEAKSMAQVGGSPVTIMNDTTTHPVTLEKVIVPLHYEASCLCYVRSTQFTNTKKGFGRSRHDSIWLYAGGQVVADSFHPARADSIVHVRRVTRVDGYSDKDVDFVARTTLVRRATDSGTVYLWTGTVSGTFKGRELAGSTFGLTRAFSLSNGFGKPMGSLFVKRGPHDIHLVFHADGTVTCTVRRGNAMVRTTHIDTADNET
jgi:hypothetical protein